MAPCAGSFDLTMPGSRLQTKLATTLRRGMAFREAGVAGPSAQCKEDIMNVQHRPRAQAIIGCMALLVAATPWLMHAPAAAAQDEPTASRSAAGSGLRHLCPGIDTTLEEALGATWQQVGQQSTVQVQMRVDGREVTFTRVSGGPIEYRRAVDRAGARLKCDAGTGGSRVVTFDVNFVGPDGGAGAPAQLARR